jgi:beta-glucanase (GH16 family)
MQDEFTIEGAPDSKIWGYDLGTGNDDTGAGWGNNELQSYKSPKCKVENGYLFTAKKESYNGSSYTSARLTTKGLFDQAYGRFEAYQSAYGKECGLLFGY